MSARQYPIEINSLFSENQRGVDSPIGLKDLPYLARPIVEHLHEIRPDAVIAADRGARFVALSALKSWKKRFPTEKFPTSDGKIHFARITSKSAGEDEVEETVHFALRAAGITTSRESDATASKIVLLDDWIDNGSTVDRFVSGVESFGLNASNISFITMCGKKVDSVDHMISDPARNTINSVWNAYDEYAAIMYSPEAPTVPIAWPNKYAFDARQKIGKYIDEYYEKFSVNLAVGRIAACACIKFE